ncbi:MAG: cysteine desulfurase [Leptospiraceae bacterium]|nr:cysteine desulfurase [Leptospiraceae bacterium]MCP5495313.1 cysteine desulfurase [Leptospiraceae bacterium]
MPYIYLDNNSTTQVDPRVLEEMIPFFSTLYANPASNHKFGVEVNQVIQKARAKIAGCIHSKENEITFTSGATEAINLAIKGIAEAYSHKGNHIITVSTEHNAVLDTCRYLEKLGFQVTYLPVDTDGLVNLKDIEKSITKETILISVMYVNNETGVIQPIQEISELAHRNNILFMTDATQAMGKIPIHVDELGIDLLVFSGHKLYAPKGIGVLYHRTKRPFNVKLEALIHGGGHENGIRSGTLNVPGIVGIARACELACSEMETNQEKVRLLRDFLETELLQIEETFLNGHKTSRMYNVTNLGFKGVDADALIVGLKNIIISNGSACSSALIESSHVLRAMGLSEEDAYSSIRLSLGKFNTREEITIAIQAIKEQVKHLRKLSF